MVTRHSYHPPSDNQQPQFPVAVRATAPAKAIHASAQIVPSAPPASNSPTVPYPNNSQQLPYGFNFQLPNPPSPSQGRAVNLPYPTEHNPIFPMPVNVVLPPSYEDATKNSKS